MSINRIRRRLVLAAPVALLAPAAALAQWSPFAGTVYEADGTPARSVWVVLKSGGRDWRSLTGYDGRFFIGNLKPGSYELNVMRGDRVLHSATVSLPAAAPQEIRLR
jgi:hypothetical protein